MFLGACSTLPNSGPTGREIRKSALADTNLAASIVEVDSATALLTPPPATAPDRLVDIPPPPTDMVGPGDVLGISIYEAGVSLFAAGSTTAVAEGATGDLACGADLPATRVNDDGYITIPYAGKLHVLGETVGEIETQIRRALRGFSQNPQVVVTRREIITNTVIVGGEVTRPGRLVLQTNRETLSDVVALAGGYKGRSSELLLRLTREG
jgi:polysaccharide export outer membrane protein